MEWLSYHTFKHFMYQEQYIVWAWSLGNHNQLIIPGNKYILWNKCLFLVNEHVIQCEFIVYFEE